MSAASASVDAQEGAAAVGIQMSMLREELTAAKQQHAADVAKHDSLEAALAAARYTQQGLQEAKDMLEAKLHDAQVLPSSSYL